MSGKFSVQVESFTARRSNSLVGFCDVVIPELRLRIKELPVLTSHGRRWAAMPGKPQLNKDGCCIVDANGKRQYTNILQFADRETSDRFSARVVEALVERFPNAFEEGEGHR